MSTKDPKTRMRRGFGALMDTGVRYKSKIAKKRLYWTSMSVAKRLGDKPIDSTEWHLTNPLE
jgi:hypothetical protein